MVRDIIGRQQTGRDEGEDGSGNGNGWRPKRWARNWGI
jgi:hypothetical protein